MLHAHVFSKAQQATNLLFGLLTQFNQREDWKSQKQKKKNMQSMSYVYIKDMQGAMSDSSINKVSSKINIKIKCFTVL